MDDSGDQQQFITDDEAQVFIMALGKTRGAKGFTEEEASKIISWAEDIAFNKALFDNVLDGHMAVDVNDEGEVVFGITKQGSEVVEQIMLSEEQVKIH